MNQPFVMKKNKQKLTEGKLNLHDHGVFGMVHEGPLIWNLSLTRIWVKDSHWKPSGKQPHLPMERSTHF